jgi:hypothetical protein
MAPGEALITASGLPFQALWPYGREATSKAFFKAPGSGPWRPRPRERETLAPARRHKCAAVTNLDDLQFQRRRCEFRERLCQFAIERLFAKTANENGDVTNRAHLISQCTKILSPAGKLVHLLS